MPNLISIQVGQPQTYPPDPTNPIASKPWSTGIYKMPVQDAVWVGESGVQGDGQSDRQHHGGIDKAVCVYSVDHFVYWRAFLDRNDFGAGGFGENLSVAGLNEATVSLGDRWRIGNAEFEVSQPRQPCWKLSRRWGDKRLSQQTISNGKTGWYLRVLKPGKVVAGDAIELLDWGDSNSQKISIAEANEIFYRKGFDRQSLVRLANDGALSASWRLEILGRIESAV